MYPPVIVQQAKDTSNNTSEKPEATSCNSSMLCASRDQSGVGKREDVKREDKIDRERVRERGKF